MKRSTLTAGAPLPAGRASLLPLLLLPLAVAACRDASVASYRIPKEKEPVVAAPSAAPAAGAPAPGPAMTVAAKPVSELTWTAPAAWKPKPASSMRRGSYDVGEGSGPLADLAITAFPGNVGGDLANVNRWRGQLNLPPIAEAELAAALQPLPANGLAIELLDITGGPAGNQARMLGAIVPFDGATWFFKLTGPAAVVAAEKARFIDFLASIRPTAPGEAPVARIPAAPAAPADPANPASPPPTAIAASAGIPDLHWTAPGHWQSKPASSLRKATYTIPAAGASAELAISAFPGDVGGELANINRWRGQLSLPPLAAADLAGAVTRTTISGLPVAIVDFPGGSQRLVGAIVPHGEATWFFKLTGPDAVVAAEKPSFLLFLQTLSAP